MPKYRPPDWKNPYYDDIEVEYLTPIVMGKGLGFEEGADALLKGQRTIGVHREIGQPFDAPPAQVSGTWVFIPDDIPDKEKL